MTDDFSNSTDENGRSQWLDREIDHLFTFVGAVGSNLNIDTLLDDAVSQLSTMVRADRILVAVVPGNEESEQPVAVKTLGLSESKDRDIKIGDIAQVGTDPISGKDEETMPAEIRNMAPDLSGSWAAIPLTVYGRQVGLMLVARDKSLGESEVKLMNLAGRQLAIAVENSRLFGDLQQSYRRLVDTQEELIRTERLAAVGGLAATMAHEIRNPLATIFSSLSQIRKHGQVSGDSSTLLEIAEEEAARLNRMVGGLLEFARPKMPRTDEVDLMDLINDVVSATLSGTEFPSGVKISVEAQTEDTLANLDFELFRRALHHVVSNSVDAVEPEDGRISILVRSPSDPGHKAVIVVKDNGSGISDELGPNIFEPFFSTKPAGIGLGLSVVKRIVEDHKGSIEVESEPGKGTEVRLFIIK